MRHTLASLWQPGKGVYIKELDTNRYLFQFYHEIDVQTVIDGSPWTFNRMPLVFHRLKRGEDPRVVSLHEIDMWVQLHDLKYGFMSEWVVKHAGNYIGTFIKSDAKNFIGVWRDYLRVRVTVDINKPLKRRMKLIKQDGSWLWTTFKYEHVPTFCFVCGFIGHSERLLQGRRTTLSEHNGYVQGVRRRTVASAGGGRSPSMAGVQESFDPTIVRSDGTNFGSNGGANSGSNGGAIRVVNQGDNLGKNIMASNEDQGNKDDHDHVDIPIEDPILILDNKRRRTVKEILREVMT
ncbi:uncharacterized protein LOC133034821 [Cannabis sativa]|uniref:uncharacterized protein LOC133034821 n=1 Tax=Cannabis sativa TaxID=3483 RepID=UPI0029CA8425|nr:uncharacterized protein LOC133034821 [Cannabis sativa]